MTSFIGYINNAMIKLSIYFNSHMLSLGIKFYENNVTDVKTGYKLWLP
jgi:hypothetical protein